MMTPEEQTAATARLAYFTSGQIASLFTLAIGLAGQTHPEELKKALEGVFDLRLVEDMARRAIVTAAEAQAAVSALALQTRELTAQINADLDNVEKRIDRLMAALDHAESRIAL